MTPEEIRQLYDSGELRLDDVADPEYEIDEDDMHDDVFEEEDEFHGIAHLSAHIMDRPR